MATYAFLVLGGILVFFVVLYNRLVAMRRLMENGWADVDVYLKRRADLIPNLVNAVKGAASFEQGTLAALSDARSKAISVGGNSQDRALAESSVTSGLMRVTAIAEAYPDLKTSANFLDLQKQLSETEKLIASARQYYNACVRDYNVMIESFPSNLVAGAAGMKPKDFFEIDAISERESPTIGL